MLTSLPGFPIHPKYTHTNKLTLYCLSTLFYASALYCFYTTLYASALYCFYTRFYAFSKRPLKFVFYTNTGLKPNINPIQITSVVYKSVFTYIFKLKNIICVRREVAKRAMSRKTANSPQQTFRLLQPCNVRDRLFVTFLSGHLDVYFSPCRMIN